MNTIDRYAARGVSSGKEEVHAAIRGLGKGLFPGAFCTILPDIAGDPEYCFVLHADGNGTQISLSYLADKHKVRDLVWQWAARGGIVMNTDDVACVGAAGNTMYINQIINRNPFRIGANVIAALVGGCKDFCDTMARFSTPLIYVGGETADVADLSRTLTLDYSLAVRFPRSQVIDASRIKAGDAIVGFSSTGQALWEDGPNSGIGLNGLTNARHDTLSPQYAVDTETYAPELNPDLVYQGRFRLEDPLPGDNRFTIASALLSPPRTYTPLAIDLMKEIPVEHIHALINCTGSGQTKIGKFGGPGLLYDKSGLFPMPPLFTMLQEVRRLPWGQMFTSYSVGHRLEAVLPREFVSTCIKVGEACGIETKIVGEVKKNDDSMHNKVVITDRFGEKHKYNF
jgi:phosphoribosylformylglycinamidine cyclo-ligase